MNLLSWSSHYGALHRPIWPHSYKRIPKHLNIMAACHPLLLPQLLMILSQGSPCSHYFLSGSTSFLISFKILLISFSRLPIFFRLIGSHSVLLLLLLWYCGYYALFTTSRNFFSCHHMMTSFGSSPASIVSFSRLLISFKNTYDLPSISFCGLPLIYLSWKIWF